MKLREPKKMDLNIEYQTASLFNGRKVEIA